MRSTYENLLKIARIVVWSLLLLGVFVMLGFSDKQQKEMPCINVDIRLKPEMEVLFTDWEDIARIVTPDGNVSSLQGQALSSFDVGKLEASLEESPYIRNAEVFTQMDGVLSIEVEQRQPLFRVFRQNSNGYYVDKEGRKMPLSSKYTARVMVLRGAIAETYDGNDTIRSETLKQAFLLMTALNEKEFWRQQIDEVQVDIKGEFVLIPKVGDQRILLGSADDLDEKLHKLRLFYKHAMNRVGWSTYKVINLKYSGQVVCEK